MIINLRTGEVLDFSARTEEEIVAELRDLEDILQTAREARDYAKSVLLARMNQAGATLLPTPEATVKVKIRPNRPTQRMVDDLYNVCPAEFRDKCFKTELKPLKRGMNQLAQLGSEWQQRVDALYQEVPTLDIEWKPKENEDVPFEPTPFD